MSYFFVMVLFKGYFSFIIDIEMKNQVILYMQNINVVSLTLGSIHRNCK